MRIASASPIVGAVALQAPDHSPEMNVSAPIAAATTMNRGCLPNFDSVVCCFIAPPVRSQPASAGGVPGLTAARRSPPTPTPVRVSSNEPTHWGWCHSAAATRRLAQMYEAVSGARCRSATQRARALPGCNSAFGQILHLALLPYRPKLLSLIAPALLRLASRGREGSRAGDPQPGLRSRD